MIQLTPREQSTLSHQNHKVSNVVSSSVFSIHSLEHLQMVLWSGSAVDKEFANYGIGACDVSMFN